MGGTVAGAIKQRWRGYAMAGEIARETFTIDPDGPLSAGMETHWAETFGRDDRDMRIEIRTSFTAGQTTSSSIPA